MTRPTHRAATLLAALAVLLGGMSTLAATPATASTWYVPAPDGSVDPMTHMNEYENRVAHYVNKHRRKAHLRPVRSFGSCIDGFSERWARHLAATGSFEHRDQRTILETCDLTWVGETLARGTDLTPFRAVRAWMHSPEHRAVLMKPRANRAGVGARIGKGGKVYVVLNFGDVNR